MNKCQLKLGHININHLFNKVQDLNVYNQQTGQFHIFGVSESRLDANVDDHQIELQDYVVYRRDGISPGQTGIAVYVHKSISNSVKRRYDLETKQIEIVWLEAKPSKSSPILIGYIYRNPASLSFWYDDFSLMMDSLDKKKCDTLR